MEKVRSADGTEIAVDITGAGPAVILMAGASCTRGVHKPLADLLAPEFTVLNYDRRGRGDSTDAQRTSSQDLDDRVARELEDLAAVLTLAGENPAVFGNSSGAALALRAATQGLPVGALALWEPPFMTDKDAPRRQRDYVRELTGLLGENQNGDAMALFLTTVGVPGEMIENMRHAPMWQGMEAVAPTLLYDAAAMGDSLVPESAARVKVPALLMTGEATAAWAADAARALSKLLPRAEHTTLPWQDHNVSWDVLAPVLAAFLR